MTVGAFNGGNSIGDFAKQYEEQLLYQGVNQKGGQDAGRVGGTTSKDGGQGAVSGLNKDDNKKVGGKGADSRGQGKVEDDKEEVKKEALHSAATQETTKTDTKKEVEKESALKTDAAKSANKAEEIKKTFATDGIDKTGSNKGIDPSKVLGPSIIENINFTKEDAIKAYETGVKITTVMSDLANKCQGNFASLSAEDLLAAFMKIQLADPAKNTETLNDLNDCMKDLRKLAHQGEMAQLRKQEVEQEKAIKEAKKAEGYAKAMKPLKIVLIVVVVVVAIAALVATCGGASVLEAFAVPLLIGAIVAAGASASTAAINMKEAANNLAVSEQAAKASEAQLEALDFERVKEMFQEMVGDNQELLQALMESFNNFCSLLKTLIDRQGASVKVLSDATIR